MLGYMVFGFSATWYESTFVVALLDSIFYQAHVGLDHFPVFIKLSLEPDGEQRQDELPNTGSDRKEADEKIQEGQTKSGR